MECTTAAPRKVLGLLDMPDEILCNILSHLTVAYKGEPPHPTTIPKNNDRQAAKLRARFQCLMVCKRVYRAAKDGHWHWNWNYANVRIDIHNRFLPGGPIASIWGGQFNETEIFIQNVKKLHLFMHVAGKKDVPVIVARIKGLLERCESLGHLITDFIYVDADARGSFVNNVYVPAYEDQDELEALLEEKLGNDVRDVAKNGDRCIQLSIIPKWLGFDWGAF